MKTKSAVPNFIWLISLVVISISLAILLKQTFSSAANQLKKVEITDVNAEIKIHRDYLGGLYLEKLKFKIPKDVNEKNFISNLHLVCFADKKGPLVINITELNPKFIVKDINGYYTLTKPIHLAGPDDTTVFYYSFDDCTYSKNLTKDLSGNNNHGIIYGNPKCVNGVEGKALGLNDSYIYFNPTVISNKTLSFCTWVKYNSFNSENIIFNIKTNINNYFYVSTYCVDGNPYNCSYGEVLENSKVSYVTNRTYELNKWYFVCKVFDGTNKKLEFWLNGKLKTEKGLQEGALKGKPTKVLLSNGDSHLKGYLDETILFNKVLKPYEIRTMYYYNCTKEGAKWFLYLGDYKDGIRLAMTEVD